MFVTGCTKTRISNALTFDLEHWHSATLLQSDESDQTDRVEESVETVLDKLRTHDVKATFFVVGKVAEEYPDLIRKVWNEGHEIGSHGYTHTPLFELTPEKFEAELQKASDAIESVTGVDPIGFRAPNFSITRETQWAFDVLDSNGYLYDSSVFPMKTPIYGVSGSSVRPYRIEGDPFCDGTTTDDTTDLVEMPPSVVDSMIRLPIAGGFYARVLPERILRWGIDRLNRQGIPVNLYFHPWEFNPLVRQDPLRDHKRFISFYGIDGLGEKLDSLLSAYNFNTLCDVLVEADLLDSGIRPNCERLPSANEVN
jgi:polysaccharide deacetylase family protein (PEP-CTERM system associated)